MDVFISSVLKENIQTYLSIQSFFKIPVNTNFFLQYIVLCYKTYSYLSDQTNFLAISLKRRLHALNKSKSSVIYLNFLNQGVNNCFFSVLKAFQFLFIQWFRELIYSKSQEGNIRRQARHVNKAAKSYTNTCISNADNTLYK